MHCHYPSVRLTLGTTILPPFYCLPLLLLLFCFIPSVRLTLGILLVTTTMHHHPQRQAHEPHAGALFILPCIILLLSSPYSFTLPAPGSTWASRWAFNFYLFYSCSLMYQPPSAPGSLFYHFFSCSPFTLSLTLNHTFLSPMLFYFTFHLSWHESHAERAMHSCILFIILYCLPYSAWDSHWVYTILILLFLIYYSMCL